MILYDHQPDERYIFRFSKEAFVLALRIERAAERLKVEAWAWGCALSAAARANNNPRARRYWDAANVLGCRLHVAHDALYLLVDEDNLTTGEGR
ncbi:MAG: hypothetical protein APF80_10940 [Alphaproteobacteria bacterium BRH_c36]|nr:MAG: hypothetical protein APF80_10940 [Alphaproteobacteria bacterium BRH_c36]